MIIPMLHCAKLMIYINASSLDCGGLHTQLVLPQESGWSAPQARRLIPPGGLVFLHEQSSRGHVDNNQIQISTMPPPTAMISTNNQSQGLRESGRGRALIAPAWKQKSGYLLGTDGRNPTLPSRLTSLERPPASAGTSSVIIPKSHAADEHGGPPISSSSSSPQISATPTHPLGSSVLTDQSGHSGGEAHGIQNPPASAVIEDSASRFSGDLCKETFYW